MRNAAKKAYLNCFLISTNSKIKTDINATNSACPLGLPQSFGQQYPIFLTSLCVQQGLGAEQKDLLMVRKQVLKRIKMTVMNALSLFFIKSMKRQQMEMMNIGSTRMVKKIKKQSRGGVEYCCICKMMSTPRSQRASEQKWFMMRLSGKAMATSHITIFFSINAQIIISTHPPNSKKDQITANVSYL